MPINNAPASDNRDVLKEIAHRAMASRGLEPEFTPQATAQLNGITKPAAESGGDVKDLRALLWCSIDNDDSRDLDQISVAEPMTGGLTKILIAVADVDAIVTRGSPLDAHARTNTTSVYTAAEVFWMLPPKLSTDLTSLNEEQDRLALVMELHVAENGQVMDSLVYRAMVRNRAKLAYNSVAAWLDGKGAMPARIGQVAGLEANLRLQDRVAQSMKEMRHSHGALVLETLQTHAVFTGDTLSDLCPDEKNRAKELIEDFMIGANTAVAKFLVAKGIPSLRRVLQKPHRWDRIVELARRLGEQLPVEPDSGALARFLAIRQKKDPARFPDLSLSVVKLLGKGEYIVEVPGQKIEGHFALAVRDYTHSTAPNRRYPDVITHRLLKSALQGGGSPYSQDDLRALAQHCTEQEDNAARVERQVSKSAAALLLANRVGEKFDAIVTAASEQGTWVRILRPPIEGKLARGASGADVGDQIHVELLSVDVERGFIDFGRWSSGASGGAAHGSPGQGGR